jgi:NAD(P)-dependent dehydrogenase (short-subunit alcohol dehydrogenase family)
MPRWSVDDIPDLHGRTALVTGANSGIGYHTAARLAAHGARVLLGCRNLDRGKAAIERIVETMPDADVELVHVDLAQLESVDDAARDIADRAAAIDILVNNAGVMLPSASRTADGFDAQMGINHLGHFALTGRLLPALLAAEQARVVTISSLTARTARPRFDELRKERPVSRPIAYSRSKLANLVFALELDRRAKAAGAPLLSIAAHPGLANSQLLANSYLGRGRGVSARLSKAVAALTGQSSAAGALPSLYAATAAGLRGGEYIGPRGPGELRGAPAPARIPRPASSAQVGARLWQVSVEATGVGFEALD